MSLARTAGRVVEAAGRVERDDQILVEHDRVRAKQGRVPPNGDDAVQGGGHRKASRGAAAKAASIARLSTPRIASLCRA
jgi:hypothetical protein